MILLLMLLLGLWAIVRVGNYMDGFVSSDFQLTIFRVMFEMFYSMDRKKHCHAVG